MGNKRHLGTQYEIIAADYLKEKGFEVIAQNFYNHYGEIDLIVKKEDLLVAVEVKYRHNPKISIFQSIPHTKINRIVKGLLYYAGTQNVGECALRVDAILIEQLNQERPTVTHVENIQANY